MYIILSVSIFCAIITAADLPTFTLLTQFTGISDENRTTESCAYDTAHKKWIFFDQETGQTDTLPGSYPITALTAGDFVNGIDTTLATLGTMFVAGTPNVVYIASAGDSSIAIYNADTDTVTLKAIDITNDAGFGTNGLCYDSDNDALYATAVGIDFTTFMPVPGGSGIWKIASPGSSSPIITRISTTNVTTAAGGVYPVYRPNGCTVVNGKVYFVEIQLGAAGFGVGGLGIYDIDADTLMVDTVVLTESADGLIAIDNYLILAAWGSADDSLKLGHLSYYDLDKYPDGTFTEAITGFVASADIAYQPSTGIICVPSLNDGTVEFVQFTAPEEGDGANNISIVIGMVVACISYICLL